MCFINMCENMTHNLILNTKVYPKLNQMKNKPKRLVKSQVAPCDKKKQNVLLRI